MTKRVPKFSILISTKNRVADLLFTLSKVNHLINNHDVECIVFDDGSTDDTFDKVAMEFPNIKLFRNEISKGYIYCRNKMLNSNTATFAISLDDDAHFLSDNCLELFESHFNNNLQCGLIACRIFWGVDPPLATATNQKNQRVAGFVGCAHVWRMSSWQQIPNYPEWFLFYGEENFAAFQLFKKNIEIHYLPNVLVHHRVDLIARYTALDYQKRQRSSFRSGWYLIFLFYPKKIIPKKLVYTFWIQLKTKLFRGNFNGLTGVLQGITDVAINSRHISGNSNRLTIQEYKDYNKLQPAKVFWFPHHEI